LPAGTGKTHLLAAAAATAATDGQRSLILTHTNAGVDAIRRRLRQFGVSQSLARVDTLTSWAFALVRSYSVIAGTAVGEIPDWSRSDDYLEGATRVTQAASITEVLSASFDYLFIDEYQDCTLALHEFVLALSASIPKAILLGDPLQAIFTFVGPMATWEQHVQPDFPAFDLKVEPHRWHGHNRALGQWLLEVRPDLVNGRSFDVTEHQVPGVQFVRSTGPKDLAGVAHSFRDFDESVLLLDKWAPDVAGHASRLGGTYTVMEDINGNFMRAELQSMPDEGDYLLAHWCAVFAKKCIVGLAGLDAPVLARLEQDQSITHYARDGIAAVLTAIDALRLNPTYADLLAVTQVIREVATLRIYRWEAWNDTRAAIAMTAENGEPPLDNLARVRDRLRRSGRASHNRIASRTLLVKGLEYDHVVIADLNKMRDPHNLYVALSRARKSVTVVGRSSRVMLCDGA
jgi:hypothetical protein